MGIHLTYVETMRREIKDAPHGHKGVVARKWAKLLDLSVQHVYRLIEDDTKRSRKGEPQKPELHRWAEVVFQIKKRPPEEAGEISTEDAAAIALKAGLIPVEAEGVPASTYDAIARKNGWNKISIRANRFQAERPNQAHHFDASTSKYFYIAKRLPGDDYLLKIHRPAKHYKNKPIPVDALRPWIYGITDDHSGRFLCRYVAATGENSVHSMEFLAYAWSEIGLPEQLLADQGMLKKALPSKDLVTRLGVELPECMPYAKRAHGKIERPWRSTWKKFELPFFAASDWDRFELPLSEMNKQLMNYIEDKYNQLPHRFEPNITRMQAWKRINLTGGIVKIPENALATAARRERRKVAVDGMLQYDGRLFEVKGLHDAWVWVFEGIFEDRLVVQDIATGNKYEVRDFKPLSLGEYRAHPETPHQALVRESVELAINKDAMLYAEKKAAPEGVTVLHIPIQTKEEREIADPFDVTVFGSLQEAMKEVYEIAGYLRDEERRWVEEEIIKIGLKKDEVIDLALDLRAALEESRATG